MLFDPEYHSTPFFTGFNPNVIPYQYDVLKYLNGWNYEYGTPEILLSGAYGSAKSILMAHIAIAHCLANPGARICLARRAMPDLKRTIFSEILEHMSKDFKEGFHYKLKTSNATIKWRNGSEIISISWSDKRYKKGRSLKLSGLIFEELTENDEDDMEAFKTLKARLRRLVDVKQNFLIAATNPDEPGHWVHEYFIEGNSNNRKVFYSVTTDNPFLDPIYRQQLLEDLSPLEAQRFIYGKWISLRGDVIYYEYNEDDNYKSLEYKIDPHEPVGISWDFNIAEGKPMSAVLFQLIDGEFHWFDECIIHSARTHDILEELLERGLLNPKYNYIICGDAAGKHKDTRSNRSDYGIIREFLEKNNIDHEMKVPPANPPIRTRHNRVNAYCKNALGENRLFVYKKCKILNKGMKLTKLKDGGQYIEDDSKEYQHCTTAIGYAVVHLTKNINRSSRSREI